MKKLLIIPVLAAAAFLAQPSQADAGFSISFSFGSDNYTPYYNNYPVTFRPGYYGPARIVVVNGRRHWLRPYNEYRVAQRQRLEWRQAQIRRAQIRNARIRDARRHARQRARQHQNHAHNHRGRNHNQYAHNNRRRN